MLVYWWGYGGGSWQAEKLRETIENLGMKLITVHEHLNADVQWNLTTIYTELAKADIIIIPTNFRKQPCKSSNRLTQAMALGKPIVCDPTPSYIPIVKQGINAFVTETGSQDEYRLLLKMLRDDKVLRERLGKNALRTAKEFSAENTAKKWLNVLSGMPKTKAAILDVVDVVIPTKNNHAILDECLKSFSNSTLEEIVYVIDNGDGVDELVKKYGVPCEVRHL